MKKVNVDALFLGPKSENHRFFKDMINFMIDEHIHWRRDFHPDDKQVVTLGEQHREPFVETLDRTHEVLLDLSNRLKASSMPWFSPRYLGHMNADTLMVANLAYMAALLYNPNNCAYEGSPATTPLEIEVGRQLARMIGYDPSKSWGHVTSGGTVANYEGLWMARNLKSIPVAVKSVNPELVERTDLWGLLNMPVSRVLDLVGRVREAGLFEAVLDASVRGIGMGGQPAGKLLVPQSRHYSWDKAVDLLGIGQQNMIDIRVQNDYRMDISHLKHTIERLISDGIPILGVVAVVGTTEEGAVDDIHEIVRLRNHFQKKGVTFYFHIDAAYGGYTRAVFLNEADEFVAFDRIKDFLDEQDVLHREIDWPDRTVYDAYKALPEADSITIDPHKMGYTPYAAGAIVVKDKRILPLISYFAAYVLEKSEGNPMLLGSYIMEGSKAGAAAAAVWAAHRTVPLNVTGYGRIIGRGIEGAHRFYESLLKAAPLEIDGRTFRMAPLCKPDFNIVDFAVNEEGNKSLEAMDRLNRRLYEKCSYQSGPVYADDWITSKTELSREAYGDAPKVFASRFGIPEGEWERVGRIYVLRSCVLTPFLAARMTYETYWENFMNTMRENIRFIVTSECMSHGV